MENNGISFCIKIPQSNLLHIRICIYWSPFHLAHGSILLFSGLIERDGGLSTLCHSCGCSCQQRVLKTLPDPGYGLYEDGVVWLWHLLVNLYIWLIISSCYHSILLTLGLIGRDGGLRTLCHSCGWRVCLSPEGAKNVSWSWLSPLRVWGSLTMTFTGKFIYIYIYTPMNIHAHIYKFICILLCTHVYIPNHTYTYFLVFSGAFLFWFYKTKESFQVQRPILF